jgi:MtN3 and saliva related transmembrane protein
LLAVEWFGFVAGAITTLGFLPQVIRVYKLRSAREISLIFTTLFLTGIGLWVIYGIFLRLLPVILWNSISLVLACALLYAKLKYGRQA